jgi:hypothetical protein
MKVTVGQSTKTVNVRLNPPSSGSPGSSQGGLLISFVVSVPGQVAVDSFAAASIATAKYEVWVSDGVNQQVGEIMVMHDGVNVWLNQYGEMWTSGQLGTFDADVQAGAVRLLFNPVSTPLTVKMLRITIPT